MAKIGLGIQLWAQNTDWSSYLEAARLVDELGYDHLWTWDHLLSAVGDPERDVFEGYTTLAAWAAVTPAGTGAACFASRRTASAKAPDPSAHDPNTRRPGCSPDESSAEMTTPEASRPIAMGKSTDTLP